MSKQQKDRVFQDFSRWGQEEQGWLPRTRRTYYYRVLAAELWLQEHRQVSLIWAKHNDLKAYLWSLHVSAATRNQIRNSLVGFGAYLEANGYAEVNPAATLGRLPQPRGIPKAMSRDELSRVLAIAVAQPPRDQTIFLLLLYTGMRLTECRTLRWQHLDLNEGWVRFWGKGQKERTVPIHDDLLPILRQWHRHTNGQDWVFPSPSKIGSPISEQLVHRTMKHIGDAAGVHIYPHLMRHTCATLLLEAGNDLRVVQEWLGHASPTTTAVYTKVRPANLRAAAQKLKVKRSRATDNAAASDHG